MRTQSRQRDLRIDFFRGLALVIIYIDHVPSNVLSGVTPKNFGYSSAADLFVLLAGISFVLAYAPRFNAGKSWLAISAILKRVGVIYLAHLSVVGLALLILMTAGHGGPFDSYIAGPAPVWGGLTVPDALAAATTLYFQPSYFDILPLYIALLLFGIPLLAVARVHWSAALAASMVTWFAAKLFHLNFPAARPAAGWYFNPLSWQVVFVVGMCIGLMALGDAQVQRRPCLAGLCIGYIVLCVVTATPCKLATLAEYCRFERLVRHDQTPWRLVNTLAWTYLVLYFIPRDAAWLTRPVSQAAILLGRNSLAVFCAGVLLSLVARLLDADSQSAGWPIQVAYNLVGPALMVMAASVVDRGRRPGPVFGAENPTRASEVTNKY